MLRNTSHAVLQVRWDGTVEEEVEQVHYAIDVIIVTVWIQGV